MSSFPSMCLNSQIIAILFTESLWDAFNTWRFCFHINLHIWNGFGHICMAMLLKLRIAFYWNTRYSTTWEKTMKTGKRTKSAWKSLSEGFIAENIISRADYAAVESSIQRCKTWWHFLLGTSRPAKYVSHNSSTHSPCAHIHLSRSSRTLDLKALVYYFDVRITSP